jgi:CHAT domain-containing protein
MPRDNFLLLRRLLTIVLAAWLAIALHFPAQSQADGLGLSLQAQQLYQAGQLSAAAIAWQGAAVAFASQGDVVGKTKSLINQSQVLQDLGLYPRACTSLLEAFNLEDPQCEYSQIEQLIESLEQQDKITIYQGIGLRSLGSILQQKGMLSQAYQLLQLSVRATHGSSESGATLLTLGNIRLALGNQERDRWSYDQITEIIDRQAPKNALEPYLIAIRTYEQIPFEPQTELITQIQAQLNHLSLVIEFEAWWQQQTQRRIQSWQRLQQDISIEAANNFLTLLTAELEGVKTKLIKDISQSFPELPATLPGIYAQLNYARSLAKLPENTFTKSIESTLQKALQQARTIKDRRGESYALGYLGQNYSRQGELNKAIAFTNQALALAEAENNYSDAREVSYLWQSQLGILLEKSGRKEEAIAAYTLAFNTLQSLRIDLNTNNRVVQFDFRQEVKPVYLRLANLLLSHEPLASSKSLTSLDLPDATSQDNLELARQVIESLQLAELDNFFQDPCSSTADLKVTIDDLDAQGAVIYPIVLSDRLEVILSLAGKPLQLFTTKISEIEVNRTLDALYDSLYNQSIDNSAVNIFSTTPLNPREVIANTQALLPNLREIYRWLIEPLEPELTSNQIETLVFVLQGKLQNVPMAALYDGQQYLLEKHSVALAPSLQLLNTQVQPRNKLKVLAAGLSQQVEIKQEIFPALNNVPKELKQIQAIFPRSQQLLNQEFTVEHLQQQLQKDFPIIHLATHGVFSSNPQQTFIVSGDRQIIDLNAFSNLLSSSDNKPELVVLSACDTATGDERAVLGLAGVAVRSGSTTVASLWSVGDDSTSKLMREFYRQLSNPDTKKVTALQQAQLSLVKSLRVHPPLPELKQLPPHPYSWAAYVLLGNWQ